MFHILEVVLAPVGLAQSQFVVFSHIEFGIKGALNKRTRHQTKQIIYFEIPK